MRASSSAERLVALVLDDEFRKFVESHYNELLGTAYLLCGSKPAAEDALQSALLRLMRYWPGINDPASYVRRVMVTQRVSRWRRVSRLREYLTEVLPERHASDETERVGTRDELFTALATLPPRTRAVIVLRYWEDLSEAETAKVLKCSAGTVKSHASRGLARLRVTLAEKGETDT
ncbi:SigE family RNA polymerase sigma factor [Micromonospora sp. KC207]|nr:SigE family RNA polymerase sigma factor [Micromonospora sp. KC207]TDC59829.1 SigE family RNA polymerase sigma factor [Micromonospora sp. KC207]